MKKNRHEQVAESGIRELDDESTALFLALVGGKAGAAAWKTYGKFRNSGAAERDALAALENIWRGLDDLTNLPWPTSEEIALDDYDGTESIVAYRARSIVADASPEASPTPVTNFWKAICRACGGNAQARMAGMIVLGSALVAVALLPSHFETANTRTLYETGVAEHRRVVLEDGSTAYLGAASRLEVDYSTETRRLMLSEGEVYFRVAKDSGRPFVVESGAVEVRAVGTAFNVRHAAKGVIVSVLEGVVKVMPEASTFNFLSTAGSVTLVAGGQVHFTGSDAPLHVEALDVAQALSWQQDILTFSGEPLQDVISSINRYTLYDVVVSDAAARELQFSGTIHRVHIEQWFEAVPHLFPLEVRRDGNRIRLLSRTERAR